MLRSEYRHAVRRPLAPLALASLLAVLALLPAPSAATVYVMPTDASMVARSPVVVFGEVLTAEPAPVSGPIATDFMFRVEEVLKGFVPGSTIVVRQPGGLGPGGIASRVIGMPVLAEGDRALLFLLPASGVYRAAELALGIFFETKVGARTLLLRDLGPDDTAQSMLPPVGGSPVWAGAEAAGPRDAALFRRWIADLAAGGEREPDYFVPELPDGLTAAVSNFRLIVGSASCERPGTRIRWRNFDRGQSLPLVVQRAGQPGVARGGHSQVLAGMQAWNSDPRSRTRIVRGARTDERLRVSEVDGKNGITFEDPHDEIDGAFIPSVGGVLAIAYNYFYCGPENPPHPVPGLSGVEAYEFVEANVTTQNGYKDWLATAPDPALAHAQIMAHELGHVLGIGHSCGSGDNPCDTELKRGAVMRARVGGRIDGPVLNADDRAAVRALYPAIGPTGPAAASDLTVAAISQNELELRWRDRSSDETAFDVYERMVDTDFERIATLERNSTSVVIRNIPPATFRAYQVVARNDGGSALPSPQAGATTLGEAVECQPDKDTLCLNEGRFRVEVQWETAERSDRGAADVLTGDTGDFWFFSRDNVELVVKVLNGCSFNERFWVYAGGVTDVKVTMTVIDSETGVAATYYNPPGVPFRPVQDTRSFAVCSQGRNRYGPSRHLLSTGEMESLRGGTPRVSRFAARSATALRAQGAALPQAPGSCRADDVTLCLESGRFAVRARWQTDDKGGDAMALPLTADTGLYWFFGAGNVEMVVKVLDGCAINGHRWVYAGGLTDVQVTMTVIDSETGQEKTYENPARAPFQPIQDNQAFPCTAPAPAAGSAPMPTPAPARPGPQSALVALRRPRPSRGRFAKRGNPA